MSGVRAVENKLFSWLRRLFVGAGLERVQKATTFVNEKQRLCLRL